MNKKLFLLFLTILLISIYKLNYNDSEKNIIIANKYLTASNNDTFRVCAYNVGNFSLGKSGVSSGTDDIYNNLIQVFNETDADVYLFSEWDKYFNTTEEILSKTKFANLGYNFSSDSNSYAYTSTSAYEAQMNMFKENSIKETTVYFREASNLGYSDILSTDYYKTCGKKEVTSCSEDVSGCSLGRGFLDDVIEIDGREVHFISTHLSWWLKDMRHEEIKSIINYIKKNNIEYFVIAGDLNHGLNSGQCYYDNSTYNSTNESTYKESKRLEWTIEDLKLFADEGYLLAQGYEYFNNLSKNSNTNYLSYSQNNNTYNLLVTSGKISTLDNIIISPNMYFTNIYTTGNKNGSDHLALVADIAFNYVKLKDYTKGYKIDELSKVITKIPVNTKVRDMVNNINNSAISINSDDLDILASTGHILTINNKDYTLSVYGDANGDGNVNDIDITQLADTIINSKELEKAYFYASDYDNNNKINVRDIISLDDYISNN